MHKVIIDGKEYIEKSKAHDLLYGYSGMNYEQEQLYEAVEKALGFKLFTWQKTFIERAEFRCLGATTAEILKILLDVDGEPLDYTIPPRCVSEDIFRRSFAEIEYKLHIGGIPTRKVFWSKKEKRDYYAEKNERVEPLRSKSHDGLRASIFIVDEMHENISEEKKG